MGAWIVASLAGEDTEATLALARRVRPWVDAVELRLDLMQAFDLKRLLSAIALPAIVTVRPLREGGRYCNGEEERLRLLREAAAQGAAAVDVEWDAADRLGDVGSARRIVSRHVFDHTPSDLEGLYTDVARRGGDVVKVATYAHTLEDALRVCHLLAHAPLPTIAIAMGEAGLISRLIAPWFPNAFLTFGASSREQAVAPGQVAVQDMREQYHVHRLRPGVQVFGLLAPDVNRSPEVARVNRAWAEEGRDAVLLPLQMTPHDDVQRIRAIATLLGIQVIENVRNL